MQGSLEYNKTELVLQKVFYFYGPPDSIGKALVEAEPEGVGGT